MCFHTKKNLLQVLNLCTIIFHNFVFQPSTENQLFHVQHINAKFRQEYRHLRLLWDEAGQTTEYALYFRNDSAGYWQVFDGQNGEYRCLFLIRLNIIAVFCREAAAMLIRPTGPTYVVFYLLVLMSGLALSPPDVKRQPQPITNAIGTL